MEPKEKNGIKLDFKGRPIHLIGLIPLSFILLVVYLLSLFAEGSFFLDASYYIIVIFIIFPIYLFFLFEILPHLPKPFEWMDMIVQLILIVFFFIGAVYIKSYLFEFFRETFSSFGDFYIDSLIKTFYQKHKDVLAPMIGSFLMATPLAFFVAPALDKKVPYFYRFFVSIVLLTAIFAFLMFG